MLLRVNVVAHAFSNPDERLASAEVYIDKYLIINYLV